MADSSAPYSKTTQLTMSELYANAVCLAPMVRAGTLPLRLLSLRYGADLVYSEEIIDKRIIASTRVHNEILNTVDFVSNNGDSVVFRTCPEEQGKVVFQIGTADAVLALKAAEQIARDVASVDINMGCPKHFSIQGGMGAALLQKPEVACDILKTLRRNLSIPVSCKIRLLHDTQATIDLAKRFEDAGAVAIGVHARQTHERPVDKAHWDQFAPVVSALSVPVLVNGDVFVREDIAKLREVAGASSFLIARGALANASIFRAEGMLPADEVVVDYLKVAVETDNVFQNTKYNVSRMIPSKSEVGPPLGSSRVTVAELGMTKDNMQMFKLWDLQNWYQQHQDAFRAKAAELQHSSMASVLLGQLPTDSETTPKFYCTVCKLQLLSDKDVTLHSKGKKHKKAMRKLTSMTVAECVAKEMVAPNDEADVQERAQKRAKIADENDGSKEIDGQ